MHTLAVCTRWVQTTLSGQSSGAVEGGRECLNVEKTHIFSALLSPSQIVPAMQMAASARFGYSAALLDCSSDRLH